MPVPLPLVSVMGFRADRAAAGAGGRAVRMDQAVRRPHLAKATRAGLEEVIMTPHHCEQVAAVAVLVKRGLMDGSPPHTVVVMAATALHPASQIHPSPMQAAVAVRSRQTLTLVALEALVAVETAVLKLLVSTARTASAVVAAAAPMLMRAETVATAS